MSESVHFPARTYSTPHVLNKAVSLAANAPTATQLGDARVESHGTVGKDGKISFALAAAKTVTCYVFMNVPSKWLLLDGTVTAAQDTLYAKDAPPGCPFFLKLDATTANGHVYDESYMK